MRLAALLLPLLLLAGCSEGVVPVDEEEPSDEGPGYERSSRGDPNKAGEERPHKDFLIFQTDLMAVGPTDVSYDVTIPVGTIGLFYMVSSESALQRDAVGVEVDGCGGVSNGGISGYFSPGTTVTESERLCSDPASGSHTFRLWGGPGTYINGKLELWGEEPLPTKGNSTLA